MRISTSTSDFLIIPGVLRTTPELIRTTAWTLTYVGLLNGLLSLGLSLVHVLTLSEILRNVSGPLHISWPSRRTSGRPVRPPVHPYALRNISALLRLSSDLRHVSYAVSELRIRATFLGITPINSAPIPDRYGLHGVATPPGCLATPSDFRRSSAGATYATQDFTPSRFTSEYPSGPPDIPTGLTTVIQPWPQPWLCVYYRCCHSSAAALLRTPDGCGYQPELWSDLWSPLRTSP
jgi:hypothetical protein